MCTHYTQPRVCFHARTDARSYLTCVQCVHVATQGHAVDCPEAGR